MTDIEQLKDFEERCFEAGVFVIDNDYIADISVLRKFKDNLKKVVKYRGDTIVFITNNDEKIEASLI